MKHAFHTACRRTAAFTLLEMLIAMVILVAVVGMMGVAFNQTQRSWLYGNEKLDAEQAGRAILQQIAGELTQAIATNGMTFTCSGNVLTFYATVTPPNTNALCELRKIQYQPVNSSVLKGLQRDEMYCGETGWPSGSFNSTATVASNQIVSLTFQCAPASGTFIEPWSPTTTLPTAVRIKLSLVGTRTAARLVGLGSVNTRLTNEYAVALSTIVCPRNAPLN